MVNHRELHRELTQVPLILLGPDVVDTSIETPVRTTDIVLIILNAIGRESGTFPGESLQNIIDDSENTLRGQSSQKYVHKTNHTDFK